MNAADKIRHATARLIGYRVRGTGYKKTHYTLTLSAALQWAACYPAATVTRCGKFIASKTTGA